MKKIQRLFTLICLLSCMVFCVTYIDAQRPKSAKRVAKQPTQSLSEQAIDVIKRDVWTRRYSLCGNNWVTKYYGRIRQFRNINFYTRPSNLSNADRVNGVEWKGQVRVSAPLLRYFNRDFTWGEWQDVSAEHFFYLEKKNGKWNVGTVVTFMDYSKVDCRELSRSGAAELKEIADRNAKREAEAKDRLKIEEEIRKITPYDIKQSTTTYDEQASKRYYGGPTYIVKLNPRDAWYDTGIQVSDGAYINIKAEGYVRWDNTPGLISTPFGLKYKPNQLNDPSGFAILDAPIGGLSINIGRNYYYFDNRGIENLRGVGRNQTIKIMVNDRITGLDDNIGGFTIKFTLISTGKK